MVTRGFRQDIEGLRAVAILLVVIYHANVTMVGGGYIGVDVFFVISGFLITGQLVKELQTTGRISIRRFYARRMTRLLPASTIVVLTTLAAAWHWIPSTMVRALSLDSLAASTWTMNLRLAVQNTDYLGAQRAPSALQHFWSLAVEEQFYAIWPLLIILVSLAWTRRGRRSTPALVGALSILSAASFGWCVRQTTTNLPWAYFGLHTRAWELGLGGLVALTAHRLARLPAAVATVFSWGGLVVILVAAGCYTDATVFPGYAAALPVVGAAFVIAGGCAAPPYGAQRALRTAPLQEIGRLSYSWYLWHWPILVVAPHLMNREPNTLIKLGLVVAALIPASMSLAAVENRIRFHVVFRGRPGRGLLLGTSLTSCAAAVAVIAWHLPPPVVTGTRTAVNTADVLARSGVAARQLANLIQTSGNADALPSNLRPSLAEAATDFPTDGNCGAPAGAKSVAYNGGIACEHRGVDPGKQTVVLFGDSHAQQWFDALNVVAQRRAWRIVVLVKGGCTPAMATIVIFKTTVPFTECDQWRESALQKIAQIRPAMVLISSLYYAANPIGTTGNADQAWAKAWLQTVQRVELSGARPVIMQDTPNPKINMPDCIAAHPGSLRSCNFRRTDAVSPSRSQAIARMAAQNGAQTIDPTSWYCTKVICPAIIGNTLVYRDTNHITGTYSRLLGPILAQELTP